MERLIKEYQGWLTDNKDFFEHLKHHDSILYHRFQPVYEVMYHLFEEYKLDQTSANEDIEKIFQIGLEYLNLQVFTCKIYLKNTFKNDFHQFLHYERVINYSLFVEDLKYELVEKSINYNEEELEKLGEYISDIIENKKTIPDNLNLYIDSKIHKIIESDDYNFTGIIDIFVEIGDALGLSFDDDTDYII